MIDFEKNINIENENIKKDSEERLTKEEIEKIVRDVEKAVEPFCEEIEKIRKENPEREINGKIVNGKLELPDESGWKRDHAIGGLYSEERKIAEEGAISFHTHTDKDLTNESALDTLAAYYRLKEIIFHKDGVSLLVALKKLAVEEIQNIDKEARQEALKEEERSGDSAYWAWKSIVQEKLPLHIVDILANRENLKK